MLYSAIGSVMVDPYEGLMKAARELNPLNKYEVTPGFKKYMRPLMGKL